MQINPHQTKAVWFLLIPRNTRTNPSMSTTADISTFRTSRSAPLGSPCHGWSQLLHQGPRLGPRGMILVIRWVVQRTVMRFSLIFIDIHWFIIGTGTYWITNHKSILLIIDFIPIVIIICSIVVIYCWLNLVDHDDLGHTLQPRLSPPRGW